MRTVRSFVPTIDRMITLNRELDRAFNEVWGTNGNGASQLWYPATDVIEKADAYLISLELPGVLPENVEISFEQSTLIVRGTKSPMLRTAENEELRVYTAERQSGAFERTFRLPQHVDPDAITASFEHGVLTVSVPKKAAAQPRKISISTSEAKQVTA